MNDEAAEAFQTALNEFLLYGKAAVSQHESMDHWQVLIQECRNMRMQMVGKDPNDTTEAELPNVLIRLMASSCMSMAMIASTSQAEAGDEV
jgi:hypothetical protein